MVARNLKSGKFAEGIINYAFAGKEADHLDKQAEVLRYSDQLLVPFDARDKEGINELISQFNERTATYLKENPENKNPLIGHQLLSFTKEDEAKLKKEGIGNVLDDYIKLANLEKTQFVAIGHKDTANYHIHLIYHKVKDDKKKENDWKLNNKTVERGIALALKNNLTLIKDQKKVALTKGVFEIRSKDSDIQKLRSESLDLRQAMNMHHYLKLLEAKKIVPDYLNDGRMKVDTKIYRPEDLNAAFYQNRVEKGVEKETGKAKAEREGQLIKSEVRQEQSGSQSFTAGSDDARTPEKNKDSSFTLVTLHGMQAEQSAVKRKRKGKHYLLKNKPTKQHKLSKGQEL